MRSLRRSAAFRREALAFYGKDGATLEAIGGERTPVVDMVCGSLAKGCRSPIGYRPGRETCRRRPPTLSRSSATANCRKGRSGRRRCSPRITVIAWVRLVAVIDANNSQVDGPVTSVTTLEPLGGQVARLRLAGRRGRWSRFGRALRRLRSGADGRPLVVIARTEITGRMRVDPADDRRPFHEARRRSSRAR